MNASLGDTLQKLADSHTVPTPRFFNLAEEADRGSLSELIDSGAVRHITDDYEEQQRELFGIKNPSKVYTPVFEEEFKNHYTSLSSERPLWQDGLWVYFPWRDLLAHILPENEYQLVRTARNQNLIRPEEQQKFYDSTVGIAGLSVGSSVAFAIALSGGCKRMKLADMDRLALTNTNRVLAGVDRLGVLKVEMAAQTIYELNPYAELTLYSEGLHPENIGEFFNDLDIVIDEIDNLAVKCLIREEAKRRGLAVVMAADNGDNAVVDIERYDLDPTTPFFHDRMGEVSYDLLKDLNKFEIGKLITKLVGPETVTERMQESLKEMGKTIVSWPQLGVAAMVNGAAVSYCIRKILTGQPIENDRALVSLDEKLIPDHNSIESQEYRKQVSADFAKAFGL